MSQTRSKTARTSRPKERRPRRRKAEPSAHARPPRGVIGVFAPLPE